MGERDQDQSDQDERDEEKERISQGQEKIEPEPGVTAGLDQFTDEEKRMEPSGVMPGSGPDEEPGPDREQRDSDTGAENSKQDQGGERDGERGE